MYRQCRVTAQKTAPNPTHKTYKFYAIKPKTTHPHPSPPPEGEGTWLLPLQGGGWGGGGGNAGGMINGIFRISVSLSCFTRACRTMNGFQQGCSPFDRLRANGCLCGSIYVVMFSKGFQ